MAQNRIALHRTVPHREHPTLDVFEKKKSIREWIWKKNEKEKERKGTYNTIYVCVWV